MTTPTHSYKTNQLFFMLIKISIVITAFSFIYFKLANNDDISSADFIHIIINQNILSIKGSTILLALTTLNWLLESFKWKTLISPVKPIRFKKALEQSLGALTASLFTPNRIGEYGAKAIYYQSNLRKRILFITLVSNLLQLFVTICLGLIGLIFFLSKYEQAIANYTNIFLFSLTFLAIVSFALLVMKKTKFRIRGFSFEKMEHFIRNYSKTILIEALLLSLFRYLIFSFQFYVLLLLFKVDISYFEAMTVITSMYLITSVIPSIFIFDVVIKGSVAVYLFSFLGINELSVLSITTIMWFLNFVIPSIIGSYYVIHFKFVKNTELQC
jgi:uncharacterized membrane protein YbhN (UPF0104 family)